MFIEPIIRNNPAACHGDLFQTIQIAVIDVHLAAGAPVTEIISALDAVALTCKLNIIRNRLLDHDLQNDRLVVSDAAHVANSAGTLAPDFHTHLHPRQITTIGSVVGLEILEIRGSTRKTV